VEALLGDPARFLSTLLIVKLTALYWRQRGDAVVLRLGADRGLSGP